MRVSVMLVVLVAFSSQAEPIATGLAWLRLQQSPDGQLGVSRGEEPLVATTEAIATWYALGLESQPETLSALSAVNAFPVRPDTELQLRRHLALQRVGWDFPVTTFAGHAEAFDASEPWLMAWSLLTGLPDAGWVTRATALTSRMDARGCLGWADNGPDAEMTAVAVLALRRRTDVPALNAARSSLIGCLLGQQRVGGDYGGAGATAMSLLALQSVSVDVAAAVAGARGALLAMQAPDGSWGTVRSTALALRALGGASPDWEARSEFGRAIVALSAPTVLQGATAQASAQFRNASAVPAPQVLVRFTLKRAGAVVVTQDVWLPSLAPGQLVSVSASLPTAGLAGTYQVEAEANAQRLLPELDVTNNLATGTVSVLQQVDLALSSGSIQFLPDTATSAKARVTVQNRGSTLSASTTVALWAFAARTGRSLGTFVVPAGTPQGQVVSGEVTFSTTDLTGFTAIHALVDPDDVVTEYDEGNNAAFRFFENGAQNAVDLQATTLSSLNPVGPVPGSQFVFSAQINNLSANLAHRIPITVIEDVTGLPVARAEIPSIAANSSGFFSVTMALTAAGTVSVIVDPEGTLNDVNRANNTAHVFVNLVANTNNFVMMSAAFSNDRASLTANVRSEGLVGTVAVRVRDVSTGAAVGRSAINLGAGAPRQVVFSNLDVSDASKVYEVCLDPEDQFAETIETDNCTEVAVSARRANVLMISRNLRFAPFGPAVGEAVTLTARAQNDDLTETFTFALEFFQGRPGFPEGKLIGRSGRLTAAAGAEVEASVQWIRQEGPAEIYARIAAVDGRVDAPRRMVAGRHLFLEEIIDLGLTTSTSTGVFAVRTGRVTGQQAPDLVVSYFVFGQEQGIAMISQTPAGRQVAWRRAMGSNVMDHALVDVDGDGEVEIVVLHTDAFRQPTLTVLDSAGMTRWTRVLQVAPPGGVAQPISSMAIGDVDSDGVADIAYHSQAGLTVRNASTGAELFTTLVFPLLSGLNNFAGGALYVADLDSDGHNEVVGAQVGRPYAVRHDGTVWWVGGSSGGDFFALADLDLDGAPELVFPAFRGPLIAVRSDTGAQKFMGAFRDCWPPSLAIGPVRQNGLPYTLAGSNSLDTRVSLHDPNLQIAWERAWVSPRVFDITLADLEGRGRPQAIYVHAGGGPMVLDSRDGHDVLPMPAEFGTYRSYNNPNVFAVDSEPPVVADVSGAGVSSNIILTYQESSGTAATNQLPGLANYYDGNVLIYGSPHWKRQPTAWPTARFVHGRVGEDLRLSTNYRWWQTHNTFHEQFYDVPARLLADVRGRLPAFSPVSANQNVSVTATVTNVGGLPASDVAVAFYDGRPSEGGRLLARSTVAGPLAVNGGAAPSTISWRAFPEGVHQLCVVVNDDGAIEEPDDEGNMDCREILVGAPGPGCDLAVLQPSLAVLPAGASPGESISLSATVQNLGAASCDATTLALDDGPPSNDTRVGVLLVPALSPGASQTVSFEFRAQAGARQWRVTSDEAQVLFDVDRSNDVATLDGFYSDAALPDFLVESLLVSTPSPAYPGEEVHLLARVRNLGATSPSTVLALTTGQRVSVPPLAAGESSDLVLTLAAPAASTFARADVDPDVAVAELDEGNNQRQVALAVVASPLLISATAVPGTAGPNSSIAVAVQTTPQDSLPRAITLFVDVRDASGQLVATLLSAAPRLVTATGQLETLTWNTGTTTPGPYTIQVRMEAAGRLLGSTSTGVQVQAGSPSLTASLLANRGTVPAGGDVVLSFAARNASGNLTLSQLVGTLSVFDAASQLIFREVRHISSLAAGGVSTGAAVVPIGRGAAPGHYTATLEFTDSTALLAAAAAGFEVRVDNTVTLAATLSAQATFQVGALVPVTVLLENFGAAALSNQALSVELVNVEAGLAVESMAATIITLGAGASQSHAFQLPTTGVPTGQKLLVARLEGRVVDTRPLTALPLTDVEPPRIDVTGITDGEYTNQDVRPVVTVSDASAFTAVALLDGAPFTAGDVVSAEALHTLTVEAQDIFGNRSWLLVRFTIDKTPPVLTLTGPADGSLHLTARTLAWTASDDSPVTTIGTLGGVTIVTGALMATEGDFTWAVRAEDAAGNVTAQTRRFAIDASAPVVALLAPAEGSYVRGPALLDWTVSEPHPGTVTALLDGSAVTAPTSVAGEGLHTLTVTATDALGNSSLSSRSFTIDDTAPAIVVTGVTAGQVTRGPVNPVVTATDAAPLALTVSVDGTSFGAGGSVTAEGAHELVARARDAAGNETSVTLRFTIDETPPVISITGVADGAFRNSSVTIAFGASDANGASATASLDGASFASGAIVAAEGPHTLTVTATDVAGNTSVRALRFELDFTAPGITISGVTNGASGSSFTPVISFSDATALTTSIRLDGALFASGTTVTAAGTHVLTVLAQDAAGNLSSRTITFVVVAIGGQCVDASFIAERRYSPSRWYDARYRFTAPVRIAVPWTLDVTAGNAGNKKAYLFLSLAGRITRCEYKGGSPVAHPQRASDVAAGQRYLFDRCTNGVTAGALRTVDDVRLHVHDGDSKRGTTRLSWRFQESQPCSGATAQDGGVPSGVPHCGHDSAACEVEDEDCGDDEHNGHDDELHGSWR